MSSFVLCKMAAGYVQVLPGYGHAGLVRTHLASHTARFGEVSKGHSGRTEGQDGASNVKLVHVGQRKLRRPVRKWDV